MKVCRNHSTVMISAMGEEGVWKTFDGRRKAYLLVLTDLEVKLSAHENFKRMSAFGAMEFMSQKC